MAVVQIADVIIPEIFSQYIVENSMVSTALFSSGVAVRNGIMDMQLEAGAEFFTVPFWSDLSDVEANISTDVPTDLATPYGITAATQVVRKSFLNNSWGETALASELSGSDALERIQSRVLAWLIGDTGCRTLGLVPPDVRSPPQVGFLIFARAHCKCAAAQCGHDNLISRKGTS